MSKPSIDFLKFFMRVAQFGFGRLVPSDR